MFPKPLQFCGFHSFYLTLAIVPNSYNCKLFALEIRDNMPGARNRDTYPDD